MHNTVVFKSLLLHSKVDNPRISNSFGPYNKSESVSAKQDFYICSLSSLLLDNNKFESCRKVATRILKRQKRKGFMFPCFRISVPYTKKSKNARMGKGKGGFHKFAHRLNCFSPFIFPHHVSLMCATRILQQIERKLPIRLCILSAKYVYTRKRLRAVATAYGCPALRLTGDVAAKSV
jgi:ribosomal protein L16/L10AE